MALLEAGVIDLALWLRPLDGDNPSGEDLRNDPRFHELERLAEPQVKVVHDENNKPSAQVSTPGDWPSVLAKAGDLRAQGRDLRLIVLLTRALANEHGFPGLGEGLTLLARTLDQYWDNLHPALRPAAVPRDAALRRVNALRDLQAGLLEDLRRRTFFAPRGVGPVTGRDLEQGALDERVMLLEAASGLNANEKAALAKQHEQLLTRVRTGCAAQADQAGGELPTLLGAAKAALAALEAVDAALNTRLETSGPAIPDLRRFLERVQATLDRGVAANAPVAVQPVPDAPGTAPPAGPVANGHDPAAASGHAGITTMGLPDRITSREEVVKCLDLVISFYDRTEPSSPIPHLAKRMRRMVPMDFIELMEDLAPSGLKEFRLLAGATETKKSS